MSTHGLTAKIREFFATNPDEELTYGMVCQKYGVTKTQARDCIHGLMRSGLLESVQVLRLRTKGIASEAPVPMPEAVKAAIDVAAFGTGIMEFKSDGSSRHVPVSEWIAHDPIPVFRSKP